MVKSFFLAKLLHISKKSSIFAQNLDITKQGYLYKTIFNGIQHSKIRYYP